MICWCTYIWQIEKLLFLPEFSEKGEFVLSHKFLVFHLKHQGFFVFYFQRFYQFSTLFWLIARLFDSLLFPLPLILWGALIIRILLFPLYSPKTEWRNQHSFPPLRRVCQLFSKVFSVWLMLSFYLIHIYVGEVWLIDLLHHQSSWASKRIN